MYVYVQQHDLKICTHVPLSTYRRCKSPPVPHPYRRNIILVLVVHHHVAIRMLGPLVLPLFIRFTISVPALPFAWLVHLPFRAGLRLRYLFPIVS